MTRLSNRQYPMLKAFMDLDRGRSYMTVSEAQVFDQRPFRSMLIQEWVTYAPRRGFHVTKAGRAAWQEFQSTEIFRQNRDAPLTRYFDPAAYGLQMPRKAPVHVMPKRGAA